jgi:diamine N-acetyltransferase
MRPYQRFLRKWITTNLRLVTKDNFDDIAELALHAHQEDLLASNLYSIAQASFHPHYHCRAIYDGEVAVGFLMYVALVDEQQPGEYAIYRLMVDRNHQGRGHGRRALELALQEIRNHGDAQKIWICYWPDNPVAKDFYASFGFVETELDEDGEMYAVLAA